jgi:hypothetical protein
LNGRAFATDYHINRLKDAFCARALSLKPTAYSGGRPETAATVPVLAIADEVIE